CCGCDLKTGILLIGILGVLGSGYGIYAGFNGAKTLINLKDEYRELDQEGVKLPIDYKYYKGVINLLYVAAAINILGLLVNLMLLFSFCTRNRFLALPYIIFYSFSVLYSLAVTIFLISIWHGFHYSFAVDIVAPVITIYFILVVYSYFESLREDPSGSVAGFDQGRATVMERRKAKLRSLPESAILKHGFDKTMAILVRTCCCGCDLRTGILLIGFLGVIGCGYWAYQGLKGVRTLINLKEKAKELDNEEEMPFDYKYYKVVISLLYVKAVVSILGLLANIMLLFSFSMKNRFLTLPYIILYTFSVFYELAVSIFLITIWHKFQYTFAIEICSLALTIYFILVVYSYYESLREDPSGSIAGFDQENGTAMV
ncbi:unnamed protein product, partial [Porites evermanni]